MNMKWLLLLILSSQVFAQHDTEGREKIMKMRAEMHQRMMEKLINGMGSDDEFLKDMDKYMNQMLQESFKGFDSYSHTPQNFKSQWKESTTGRTFEITPHSPSQQLDINVQNNMITIKGQREVKTANGTQVSQFSNSFSVPGDCEATKMKMDLKDGKILVFFPYYKPTESKPRKPIGPSDKDVQI